MLALKITQLILSIIVSLLGLLIIYTIIVLIGGTAYIWFLFWVYIILIIVSIGVAVLNSAIECSEEYCD